MMLGSGAGALCAPLVATQFAQLPHWSYHYLVSLGIAISNTIILVVVFRFKTQDGMSFLSMFLVDSYRSTSECLEEIGQTIPEQGTSGDSTFRQILAHKTVNLLAFFILVYVGVEVTVGGS
jgi:fucose permease